MNEKSLGKVKKNGSHTNNTCTPCKAKTTKYLPELKSGEMDVQKAIREFEKQIAKEAKNNPKAFYGFHAYARGKMKTREGVADLDNAHGILLPRVRIKQECAQ